jgi:transposase-like protein
MTGAMKGRFGEAHPAHKVTDETRNDAIERVASNRFPAKFVASQIGVTESTVCAWVRKAGYTRRWVKITAEGT